MARAFVRKSASLFLPVVAAAAYAAWGIHRHDRFATSGFDLGIFDQTIWGYSRFEVVANTIKRTPNLLGDHFHPLLASLAPTYWIWNDARVLLVDQGVLIALASVPLFIFALDVVDARGALLFQAAFLLSWPVWSAVSFDFHEVALAAPLLSWSLLATIRRHDTALWALAVSAFLVREDVALAYVGIALYIAFGQRRYKLGLGLFVAAVAWLVAVTHLIIPAISDGPYAYWTYGALASGSALSLAVAVVERPWVALSLLVDRAEKVETLVRLAGSWALLPLLSPISIVALPLLAERFWSSNEALWGTRGQYSLLLAPILSFAAVDAVARLQRREPRVALLLPGVALVCAAVVTFVDVRPFSGLHPVWSAQRSKEARRCLDVIPGAASVAAADVFVPHLSHRREIAPLFTRRAESYLVIDAANPVGRRFLRRATTGRPNPPGVRYDIACRGGMTFVLRRT
jgi:uncharacterized membrane protein